MSIKSFFFIMWDLLSKLLWQRSGKGSKLNGVVLMYHHITDEFVDINLSCRCPIKVFEHYLDDYQSKGFKFVSLQEAYNIINSRKEAPPFCIITFDDIPANVYQNAYPILKARRIPFAVFVTTQFVDSANPKTGQRYITREMLHNLDQDSLCTIGAHTTSHCMLRNTKNSYEEMQDNKNWLERELGHSIDFIAYPYGKHSSVSCKIQKQAKRIGFKMAFGTIDAPITDRTSRNLFYLPRMIKN